MPSMMDRLTEDTPEDGSVFEQVPQQKVCIKLHTREFYVDADIAEALALEKTKREADFFRKISEQGTELHQLRQEVHAARNPVVPPDTSDFDLKYWQSPSQAVEERLAEERKRIEESVTRDLTE